MGRLALLVPVLAAGMAAQRQPVIILACVAVVAALDVQRPIALRNYFALYSFLLFIVGGAHFFPDEATGLAWDMCALLLAFIAGYALLRGPRRFTRDVFREATPVIHARLTGLIIVATATKLVIIGYHILSYGAGDYFRGQFLVDRIGNYGKYDAAAGVDVIVTSVTDMVFVAAITLYVTSMLRAGLRLNWLLMCTAMIMPGMVALQRSEVAFAVLYLFAVRGLTERRRRFVRSTVMIAVGSTLVISSSLFFGQLRQQALTGPDNGVDVERYVYGELSPIVMYHNVREHPSSVELQLGRTIVVSLAEKWIPRNLMPDKADSSGGYLARVYDPEAFRNGFALAPTVFADFLLNFGWAGTIAGCGILGIVAARLDRAYAAGPKSRLLPVLLITYYYAYSILRNDLTNSLSALLLSLLVYVVLARVRWIHGDRSAGAVSNLMDAGRGQSNDMSAEVGAHFVGSSGEWLDQPAERVGR